MQVRVINIAVHRPLLFRFRSRQPTTCTRVLQVPKQRKSEKQILPYWLLPPFCLLMGISAFLSKVFRVFCYEYRIIEFLVFLSKVLRLLQEPKSASESHKYRHIGHRAHSVCCEYLACFELCLFCPQYLGRSRQSDGAGPGYSYPLAYLQSHIFCPL